MTENELFLKRSDELAYKLRLSLRELAPKLGLSAGSFFGYRTGRVALSAKAWRKLEEVERRVAVTKAADALTVRLVAASEAGGETEDEKQALFDEMMEKEKMPLIEEILRLRHEVERLRFSLAKAGELIRTALTEKEPKP